MHVKMNETEDNEATCKPHNVEEKGTEDSLPAASGELLAFLSVRNVVSCRRRQWSQGYVPSNLAIPAHTVSSALWLRDGIMFRD